MTRVTPKSWTTTEPARQRPTLFNIRVRTTLFSLRLGNGVSQSGGTESSLCEFGITQHVFPETVCWFH